MAKKFKLKLQYPSEKQVQDTILEWLNLQPRTFAWRQNSGKFLIQHPSGKKYMVVVGTKGMCDIIASWKGRFLAIEVKSFIGKLSDEQRDFIEMINDRGGISFVAHSLDEVIKTLEEIDE